MILQGQRNSVHGKHAQFEIGADTALSRVLQFESGRAGCWCRTIALADAEQRTVECEPPRAWRVSQTAFQRLDGGR